MAETPSHGLAGIIGDAYRAGSIAGADMVRLAGHLEPLKRGLVADTRPDESVRRIGAAIAAAHPDEAVVETLAGLRAAVCDLRVATLARAAGTPEGDAALLDAVAVAAADLSADLLVRFAAPEDADPPLDGTLRAEAEAAARAVRRARFPEARPLLTRLADDARVPTPTRGRLLVVLAQITLYRLEQLPEAERLLDRAEALDPGSPWAALARGEVAAKCADWAGTDQARRLRLLGAARLAADRIVAGGGDPQGLAAALALRADVRTKVAQLPVPRGSQGGAAPDPSASEADLREAIGLAPWDPELRSLLAQHLIRTSAQPDDREVAALVGLGVALAPGEPAGVLAGVGAAHADAGRTDDARDAYDRALAAEPGHLDVLLSRAWLLQARDDVPGAEAALADAEAASPGTHEVPLARAWLAESEERWEEALSYYRQALARRPEAEPAMRAECAWSLTRLGRFDEATEEAVRACEILAERGDAHGPAVAPATNRLLEAVDRLEEAGRDEEADRHLRLVRAVLGEGFEPEYRNRRAVRLHDAGRHAEAIAEYRLAIAAGGDTVTPRHHHNLALALTRTGDLDGALEALEACQAIDGDDPEHLAPAADVWNIRGNRAFEADDLAAAERHYRRALELTPGNAVMLSNLAGTLLPPGGGDRPAVDALREMADLLDRAEAAAPGGGYTERAAQARAGLEAVAVFGGHLAAIPPFSRIRVGLSAEAVRVLVDDERTLKPAVQARLDRDRDTLGPFGRPRPGIRFHVDDTCPRGSAVVMVGGVRRAEVPVRDADGTVDDILRVLARDPGAMLGPDDAAEIVRALRPGDADALIADADALAGITRALRTAADAGATDAGAALDTHPGAPAGAAP